VLAGAILVSLAGRRVRGRRAWSRWHYRLGWAAAILGVGHALVSITRARLPPGPEIGLWLASAAAALIVIEALIGLRDPGIPDRPRVQRYHLAAMAALVLLVGLHVVLNGPLPR
jgi:hypothetical protein